MCIYADCKDAVQTRRTVRRVYNNELSVINRTRVDNFILLSMLLSYVLYMCVAGGFPDTRISSHDAYFHPILTLKSCGFKEVL